MTINSKYFRTRRYARIRHARKLPAFLAGIASALSATAAAHTVSPKHTSQIGPEATLTISGGSVVTTETVTLQGIVYKFVTALTEAFASAVLTTDGTKPSDGDTVVIGAKTYTFQTTLTNVDGHVHIGADVQASYLNLARAINASGGTVGTDYATLTVANANFTAVGAATTVTLTAKASGVRTDATTTAGTHPGTFGGATVTGGIAASAFNEVLVGNGTTDPRDNLVAAITGSGAAGKYQSNIVANTDYTATAVSGNVLVQSLVSGGVRPARLCTLSTTSAHIAAGTFDGPNWTATTHGITEGAGPFLLTNSGGGLPAGSPTAGTELYVHVVDANTIALAVGREALRKGAYLGTTTAGTGTHSVARSVTAKGVLDTLERGVKPRTAAAATDVDGL